MGEYRGTQRMLHPDGVLCSLRLVPGDKLGVGPAPWGDLSLETCSISAEIMCLIFEL